MRLKKGSAAAKAWGAKMKRLRNKSPTSYSSTSSKTGIKKRQKRTMAKKRKKSSKKSFRVLGLNVASIFAPMLYGGVRSKISQQLAPITAKIPAGNVSDEVAKYAALWAGKKFLFKQKSILRDACTAGQNIELARIGEAVFNGQLGLMNSGSGTSNGYVFN